MASLSLGQMNGRAFHVQTLWRLALLVAVPTVIGLGMWVVAYSDELRSEGVRHTLIVELALQQLITDMSRVEGAERRVLLLSGDAAALAAYRAAAEQTTQTLSRLGQLTSDNPNQIAHLAAIRPLVEQQLARAANPAKPQDRSTLSAADALKEEGEASFSSTVERLVAAMFAEEEGLLISREAALRRSNQLFLWVLVAGYAVMLVTVVSLYRSAKYYSERCADASASLRLANEELEGRVRHGTRLLSARQELFEIFVRYVPAAVAMLDRELRYLHVSDGWCSVLGLERERFIGHANQEVFPSTSAHWREIHRRCLDGETMRGDEDKWERPGKPDMWFRWEIRPWGAKDGRPEGLLIFFEDITERRTMEQALRENEATTRTLLDTASQSILVVDQSGYIRIVNRMATEMFGYPRTDLLGQPLEILLPDRYRAMHLRFRKQFATRPEPRTMGSGLDLVGLRKDGSEFPIEVSLSSVPSKEGLLSVAFVSDITLRKRAEEETRDGERKLRLLAGSLLSAQEEERRKVARELHDDVTQRLAFMTMELGRLGTRLDGCARDEVAKMQEQMRRICNEAHRMSRGLHPSVIIDFGLSIALEDFCEEFRHAHGIDVQFQLPPQEPLLDDASATCLFRVAQESLRNAAVHGAATIIDVSLTEDDGWLTLKIEDNGAGFCTDALRTKKGLGVISMQERMRHVRGNLRLTSEPGRGTVVIASVPVSGGDNAAMHRADRG